MKLSTKKSNVSKSRYMPLVRKVTVVLAFSAAALKRMKNRNRVFLIGKVTKKNINSGENLFYIIEMSLGK